ncbi:MaoC family dehydratase [Mycolicibacterium setense]|uniref:MaoC family dehydratase n=1 Tax=Mycolicibacterium setense TaxID=431269 RepID=UPI002E100F80
MVGKVPQDCSKSSDNQQNPRKVTPRKASSRVATTPQRIRLVELPTAGGQSFGPTDWLEITQGRVDAFADSTGDRQWIHVDPARAANSPYGGTIAHGFLNLALCSHFLPQLFVIDGASMAINYGVDRVRFPAPVLVGAKLRGAATIEQVSAIDDGFQLITTVTLTTEGASKPSCIAAMVTRYLY